LNLKVCTIHTIFNASYRINCYTYIGARQAAINVAEGQKQSKILASEAQKAENINQAKGEAEAILLRAKASAEGIVTVAKAIGQEQGSDAVAMSIAEKYVHAFGQMAKESTTLIVPATANDAASLVSQVKNRWQFMGI
jgi:regulator of protease activity HflC (stomatin/prohibitin superfamily)